MTYWLRKIDSSIAVKWEGNSQRKCVARQRQDWLDEHWKKVPHMPNNYGMNAMKAFLIPAWLTQHAISVPLRSLHRIKYKPQMSLSPHNNHFHAMLARHTDVLCCSYIYFHPLVFFCSLLRISKSENPLNDFYLHVDFVRSCIHYIFRTRCTCMHRHVESNQMLHISIALMCFSMRAYTNRCVVLVHELCLPLW